MANVEKSLIVVYRDPFAVLDLPLALGANDDAYVVNKSLVPRPGTPCTVILEPGAAPPPEKNARGGRILHVDVTRGGRVLINNLDLGDVKAALKTIAAYAPRDSCKLTVDHGPTTAQHVPSTAAAAAAAFEALAAAGIPIESVDTTRTAAGVRDLVVVSVVGDEVRIDGKAMSDKNAALAVRERLTGGKGGGIAVQVENGASLPAVARALRACDGAEDGRLRMIWNRGTPAAPPVGSDDRPKNEAGGRIFPVAIRANGDVRIAGVETIDPAQTLRIIGTYAPNDSCTITVDHGAPPDAVARTLGGVVHARSGIESLRMTRVRADVKDAVTIVVERDDIRIDGTRLADVQSAKQVVYAHILAGKKGNGVVVQVNRDASLHGIEKALEACEGAKTGVLRILWRDK